MTPCFYTTRPSSRIPRIFQRTKQSMIWITQEYMIKHPWYNFSQLAPHRKSKTSHPNPISLFTSKLKERRVKHSQGQSLYDGFSRCLSSQRAVQTGTTFKGQSLWSVCVLCDCPHVVTCKHACTRTHTHTQTLTHAKPPGRKKQRFQPNTHTLMAKHEVVTTRESPQLWLMWCGAQ